MSASPALTKNTTPVFPLNSLLGFLGAAVVLRVLAISGEVFFPGDRLLPHFARVLIPLLGLIGLFFVNQRWLARDGFAGDVLGLGRKKLFWLPVGAALIIPVIALLAGTLLVSEPAHYETGTATGSQLAWWSAEYFAGNAGEELLFRGYLLILLLRQWGVNRALLVTGFVFGLFHLPGLSGVAAAKMVLTTFAASYLYAYGFLLTGSLWTAIGMHVAGNIVLHHVAGLSGESSLFIPVFPKSFPVGQHSGFAIWFIVIVPIIVLAALRAAKRGLAVKI